jgi:hypothetical protein
MGISVTLSNTMAKRRATEVTAFIDAEKEQHIWYTFSKNLGFKTYFCKISTAMTRCLSFIFNITLTRNG